MISQETIEQIKSRARLIEIVSETVTLKRQGANYSGLCPFHAEKTPSFSVKDTDNYYHCFGCGVSGNVISYVMQIRGVSFTEAIEELAARYGIEIKREGVYEPKNAAPKKQIFYNLNKVAHDYFRSSLRSADPKVIEYIRSRGLSAEAITEFGIGFAPRLPRALYERLAAKKVESDILDQCGLVRRNAQGEMYDWFRGRLIFPIWIDTRRIAGFGGRIINSLFDEESVKSQPKYLNSPETVIYQKKKTLYGLPQALPFIREEKELYLVEGYMDMVGLWQSGVKNSLASCGTALSEAHVERLSKFTNKVVILFDGDDAGRTAAGRSFQVFLNSGVDAHALFLPKDEDPDTVAKKHGERTAEYLKGLHKEPLVDCYLAVVIERFGFKEYKEIGAAAKGRICEEVATVLNKVENKIERDELISRVALKLGVEAETLSAFGERRFKPIVESVPAKEGSLKSGGFSIEELPPVDRQLLLAVMALKLPLASKILGDPEFCGGLHSATVQFVEGLNEILTNSSLDDESRRSATKSLLMLYGPSWLGHWRKAHEMVKDAEVDMDSNYSYCRLAIQKNKLIQTVNRLEQDLHNCLEEEQRLPLMQDLLLLRKQLSELSRPVSL